MINKSRLSLWAILLALATTIRAESVSLPASADASLFEVNPGNSAGGDTFFVSGTTQNGPRSRALIQFDIASAVPAGSRILGVGMQLEVTRVPIDGFEASLFGLHRVLRSWGEGNTVVDPEDNFGGKGAPAAPGDATWLDRFHGSLQPWAAPGAAPGIDYTAEFSGSVFLYSTDVYSVEGTPAMVADVQYWLDNPTANHGWILISGSEDLRFTARRFASSEDPNGGGPMLFIDYEPIPEPRSWVLLGSGCLFLFALRFVRSRR